MTLDTRKYDPRHPEIVSLLEAHLDLMRSISPPDSVHALDLEGLLAPEITFWACWEEDDLLGCGALKELDAGHGEIKSMHTAVAHRGKGVAATILRHIIDEARTRYYSRLSLETGSMDEFIPARSLYTQFGFEYCGPFASYSDDPESNFMTLALAP